MTVFLFLERNFNDKLPIGYYNLQGNLDMYKIRKVCMCEPYMPIFNLLQTQLLLNSRLTFINFRIQNLMLQSAQIG